MTKTLVAGVEVPESGCGGEVISYRKSRTFVSSSERRQGIGLTEQAAGTDTTYLVSARLVCHEAGCTFLRGLAGSTSR